jgi:hypothetical protein
MLKRNYFEKLPLFVLFLGIVLAFGIRSASAAQLIIQSDSNQVENNQSFNVSILLNTNNTDVNAVEGTLIFPKGMFDLKDISDANSIINFWIQPLKKDTPCTTNTCELHFTGIIPGGYNGENGLLLSALVQATDMGQGTFTLKDVKVLQNDGLGTALPVSVNPLNISIGKSGQVSPTSSTLIDPNPPESFQPEVGRDPYLFNNKWFIVFSTQDKGSGMAYYQVTETRTNIGVNQRLLRWVTAESPYILRDQALKSYIYVKAVDKAGNARIEMIPPKYKMAWYENYLIWLIILLLSLSIAYPLWRKLKR